MVEAWLPIKDYEGYYEVSDSGRVRSLDRLIVDKHGTSISLNGKIIKQSVAGDYLSVGLSKSAKLKVRSVHLLVLETFVGSRPGHWTKWHGCHNDGDWQNNSLLNLRWDTVKANCADAMKHGSQVKGERHANSRLTERDIAEIKRHLTDETMSASGIALSFGVSRQNVSLIKLGKIWGWVPAANNDNSQLAKEKTSARPTA